MLEVVEQRCVDSVAFAQAVEASALAPADLGAAARDEWTPERSLAEEIEYFASHIDALLGYGKSKGFALYRSESELRGWHDTTVSEKIITGRRQWIGRTVLSGRRIRTLLAPRGESTVIVSQLLDCIDHDQLAEIKPLWREWKAELRDYAIRSTASPEEAGGPGNTHDLVDEAKPASQTAAVPSVDLPNEANNPTQTPPSKDEWRAWALCNQMGSTQKMASERMAVETRHNWYQSKVSRAVKKVETHMARGGRMPDFLAPSAGSRSPGRIRTIDPSLLDKGSPTTHTQRPRPDDPKNT